MSIITTLPTGAYTLSVTARGIAEVTSTATGRRLGRVQRQGRHWVIMLRCAGYKDPHSARPRRTRYHRVLTTEHLQHLPNARELLREHDSSTPGNEALRCETRPAAAGFLAANQAHLDQLRMRWA